MLRFGVGMCAVLALVVPGAAGAHSGKSLSPLTLQVGATYSSDPDAAFGQSVQAPISIAWPACEKARSHDEPYAFVRFSGNSGIFNADGTHYGVGADGTDGQGGAALSDAGHGHFVDKVSKTSQFGDGIYVSPIRPVGTRQETVYCHTTDEADGTDDADQDDFTAKIKVTTVLRTINDYRTQYSPPGVFQAIAPGPNPAVEGSGGDIAVSVPECRDQQVGVTLTSPGITAAPPDTQAGGDGNQHGGELDFRDWDTNVDFKYETAVYTSGTYPITIACHGLKIATGLLQVL